MSLRVSTTSLSWMFVGMDFPPQQGLRHLTPPSSPRKGPELSKVLKSVNKVKPGLFSLTDILVPVPLLLASRATASFTLLSGISVVTQRPVHRGTLPVVQRSAGPILKCAVNSGQRVLGWHLALARPCYLACAVLPKVLKTSGFSSEKGKQQAVFLTLPIHRLWRVVICRMLMGQGRIWGWGEWGQRRPCSVECAVEHRKFTDGARVKRQYLWMMVAKSTSSQGVRKG